MSSSLPRVNAQFLPIVLQGHSRPITTIKFNSDGDLLFTAAKDNTPTVWYAETGERLGTYDYHGGAVNDIDPSWDSQYVVTACGDFAARLFETTTGKYIARMPHKGVVRASRWGDGNQFFATASDPFTSRDKGCISIYNFPTDDVLVEPPIQKRDDPGKLHASSATILIQDIDNIPDKAICLGWTIADEYLIAGFDSGHLVKYDVQVGKEVMRKKIHEDRINKLSFNRDKSMAVSASSDCSAKLIDPLTLEVIKTYKTDRPVNGAVISPTHPHIILGGGQDSHNVTTTSASHGKFETRFYHMIYEEEFGRVKGHFGPINALDVHPFGKSFASGSEDGFVRLHHFDVNYLTMPDYIPTSLK